VADVAVVRPDDYEELASFMAGFPGVRPLDVAGWRSRLATWWDANPAFEESFPRGWLLRDNGTIGGFFGSIPLTVQLAGEEATAFSPTSWRVFPQYRGKSLSMKLLQLETHKEHLHFSTTPQKEMVPLLTRLGYRPIPRGETARHQSLLILDAEKFLRIRFRDGLLGKTLTLVGAPVFAAVQSIRTRRLKAEGEVRELSWADEAFDDLWQRTRSRFANTNVRTADMVNWYCFAMKPVRKKLLASYEGGTLLGYMILIIVEDPGRRFLECVDVWIDPAAGEERVLAGLVAKAKECAVHGAFERLLFPHFDPRTAALYGDLGLIRGPAWQRREYIKGPRDLMDTITLENSYFVRAQGDYEL
jgi:hypothetical protein